MDFEAKTEDLKTMKVEDLLPFLNQFQNYKIYFNGNKMTSLSVNNVDKILNIESPERNIYGG